MLRLDSGGAFQKPLSQEEEREMLRRFAGGDDEARKILIERNLRLVAHIIKKYYTSEDDREDLISIGTIGLIKGINTYKPEKKVHLSTYASRCIENEILMYFRSQKKLSGEISIDDSIEVDSAGNPLTLIDILSKPDDMIDKISAKESVARLSKYIAQMLTPLETDIIFNRYGFGGRSPKTQREIAAGRKISRSYVSRIETRALGKLKRRFEEDDK
jgi:RNA polymerase sporulation-specific sigma factor